MEAYLGEIRAVAFNYPPRYWAACDGQIVPIGQNQALFALLGTRFGGDGISNFALPDLRGRVPMHFGALMGFVFPMGSFGGAYQVTLNEQQMPTHNHGITMSGGTTGIVGNASATMNVNNVTDDATASAPSNMYLGVETTESGFYASGKDAAGSTLNPGAIDVNTSGLAVDMSGIQATIGDKGGSQPHLNTQPYLTLNFIICMDGEFPPRN
jgi:microcystin-dependent protein